MTATTARRWVVFYAVGGVGFVVQLVVLAALVEWARMDYLLATALATEAAVLHNFVWHESWTWRDRTTIDTAGLWRRCVRFNLSTGTVSVLGNVALTGFFASLLGVHYIGANILAIAACSVLNFLAADRLVFVARRTDGTSALDVDRRGVGALVRERGEQMRVNDRRRRVAFGAVGIVVMLALPVEAAELKPKTLAAWTAYVAATEARIAAELRTPDRFLVMDFQPQADAEAERAALRDGRILVTKMRSRDGAGRTIDVPSGAIHHWWGAMFVPHVTLEEVLARARQSAAEDELQEDVLESRILEEGPDTMRVFLKLKRKKFITVVFNTEHAVEYARHGATRASSTSRATKIAELADPETPDEREKPEGRDRGFLWRLNSYWRYQAVEGGVIVECESLTLSRSIPAVLRLFVCPLINSAARESMDRTLGSMRTRLTMPDGARPTPVASASAAEE
jgi:putative flippase GtrA